MQLYLIRDKMIGSIRGIVQMDIAKDYFKDPAYDVVAMSDKTRKIFEAAFDKAYGGKK